LIFAQRAFAPALILALASGDMVYFFLGDVDDETALAGAFVGAAGAFNFAHRAF